MCATRNCPKCGTEITDQTLGGLCPSCVGALAFDIQPDHSASGAANHAFEKPGDRIGRYTLLRKIGAGGCGIVYSAQQEEPVRRQVALKIVKLGMDTRSVIARFAAERQALAVMDHANIAKVLDAGATDTGRPYFVMELVKGIPITHYCNENCLNLEHRLRLFIQVCHAIQHAHQKGIIHRDIKPSNVLVAEHDGRPAPKIIDFGIAKATAEQGLSDHTVFTAVEQFMGTPAYMSPEQARLSGVDIDTRSDIYSLGVLLYELLTGGTPFDARALLAAGPDEMRRIVREEEPVKPSTRLAQQLRLPGSQSKIQDPKSKIDADLDWIVMKALEKDRTRRYETANGLAMDIERFLREEPVTAVAPGAEYRLRKFLRRHRAAVLAGGLVLLASFSGIVGTTWALLRALEQQREAQRQTRQVQQTTDFLIGMFSRSYSPGAKVGDITVEDVLDRAGRTIDESFSHDPLAELRIRRMMASIYENLERADRALPYAEAELRLAQTIHGTKNLPEIYGGFRHVAFCLKTLGRHSEALVNFEAALETLQRIYDRRDQLDVARCLNEIGSCLDKLGRSAEGLENHEAALAMLQRISKEDHPELAQFLQITANSLNRLGRPAEALPMAEAGLEMSRRLFKGNHEQIIGCLQTVADCLDSLGRSAEASEKHQEVLTLTQVRVGAESSHKKADSVASGESR